MPRHFPPAPWLRLSFNNSRITTNVPFDLVNPQISPSFNFQLTQHLLQGFGFDPNLRWIRIARNTRENGDVVFRQQIIATVSQVENIYWDLVTAYEAVRVNERALQLAHKTLSDDQEQIRIGTLAPITLVQAKSGVANANQNPDHFTNPAPASTTADEERHHQEHGRSDSGGCARNSDRHVANQRAARDRPVTGPDSGSLAGPSRDCSRRASTSPTLKYHVRL